VEIPTYFIESGPGFLLEIQDNTPELTSNIKQAVRFDLKKAIELSETLGRLGFEAKIYFASMLDVGD
jgi:hypothetical protein